MDFSIGQVYVELGGRPSTYEVIDVLPDGHPVCKVVDYKGIVIAEGHVPILMYIRDYMKLKVEGPKVSKEPINYITLEE